MHTIVMWLGGIVAAMGLIFFVLIALTAKGAGAAGLFSAVGIGGGLIVSGALLYCFGAIVEHLIAIRKAAERQVYIFDKLGKGKAS